MKIKKLIWIGMGMLVSCYAGSAFAETVPGTVASIGEAGRNATLRRAETDAAAAVVLTDGTSLGRIVSGRQVSLDANRNGNVWESQVF